MSRLSAFLSLPVGDQARALVATVLLLSLPTGISIGSFGQVRSELVRYCDAITPAVPGEPSPQRIAQAVALSDRAVPGSRTCLVRSLTAETLLRLYGYEPEHRIGVDKVDDGVNAHSWLVYEGEVLIGDLDDLSQYDILKPAEREEQS